jgi:hypothetical protein
MVELSQDAVLGSELRDEKSRRDDLEGSRELFQSSLRDFSWRPPTQDCVPQALTYWDVFLQNSHKSVILSEALHRFIA